MYLPRWLQAKCASISSSIRRWLREPNPAFSTSMSRLGCSTIYFYAIILLYYCYKFAIAT